MSHRRPHTSHEQVFTFAVYSCTALALASMISTDVPGMPVYVYVPGMAVYVLRH